MRSPYIGKTVAVRREIAIDQKIKVRSFRVTLFGSKKEDLRF